MMKTFTYYLLCKSEYVWCLDLFLGGGDRNKSTTEQNQSM